MFWSLEKTVKTVKDMYDYRAENNLPLLPTYRSGEETFWSEYNLHSDMYDSLFCRMFKTWRYFNQDIDGTNAIADVTNDFISAVNAHLAINDKKYTMLYRVHTETDNMNIMNDIVLSETNEGSKYVDAQITSGAREDGTSRTSGARSDTDTERVMAFNSSQFVDNSQNTLSKGEQTDSATFNKGTQTDMQDIDETNSYQKNVLGNRKNQSDNINKYSKTWKNYSFYEYIFLEIAKDLLLI